MLYGFLGVNGAGKTTTLRMISGLSRPDAGQIRVLGIDATSEPQRAKQPLAYIPDDPVLYGKLNPMEHLEFVSALWGIEAPVARRRAQELLERLSLWDRRREWIESYSRGMKQKVALASALIHEPRLILLDEPLTGLDASAARQVKDILLEYLKHGGAVILTTHHLGSGGATRRTHRNHEWWKVDCARERWKNCVPALAAPEAHLRKFSCS